MEMCVFFKKLSVTMKQGKFLTDIPQQFKNNLSPKSKIKMKSYINFYCNNTNN